MSAGQGNIPGPNQQVATFAERLAVERARSFVGRDSQLHALDTLLATDNPTRLWFIAGPGGVGKTTLLHAFRDQAQTRNIPVMLVDARNARATPPAARQALEEAAGHQPLTDWCASHPTPLLLIDTFEQWQDLEWWLRERLLPEMPATLHIVIAGRREPAAGWYSDPGWSGLLQTTTLDDLTAREAGQYLTLRGVHGRSRRTLLQLADGRPLVLALGADMVDQGRTLERRADTRPIIERLVDRFTSDAELPAQRQALDAAAVVREINESLLARMLAVDDAQPLYQWLAQLSFMAPSPDGLLLHDQVRVTLMQDMKWRFPGRYETGIRRAFDWIVDQIEAADRLSWMQATKLAGDAMYALRALGVVNHFLYPKGVHSLYIEEAGEQDWPVLADMIMRHEGIESRGWFEFWCARAPDTLFVVRDPTGTARGMFLRLDMETLAPADRDQDPLTALFWQHIITHGPAKPHSRHLPFIRFWSSSDQGHSQSAAKTAILMAINSYNLMARNNRLDLTAQVFLDTPEWEQQARALGIARLPGSDTRIGDITWRIYCHDWQQESPAQYYRRFADRCITFEAAMTSLLPTHGKEAEGSRLDQRDFSAAVAEALKAYHVSSRLAGNPLLGSALILTATGRGDNEEGRIELLRQRIRETIHTLAQRPEPGPTQALALGRTYLQATTSQKQTAAALAMGYSTYRRHLARAREALADELWRREIALR